VAAAVIAAHVKVAAAVAVADKVAVVADQSQRAIAARVVASRKQRGLHAATAAEAAIVKWFDPRTSVTV